MKTLTVLGIETSCDETATSIIRVDDEKQTFDILGNTVHSQIDIHASYGGVFPILAKREHQINIIPVLIQTLSQAGMYKTATSEQDEQKIPAESAEIDEILSKEPELLPFFKKFIQTTKKPDIDYISITVGPGLEPALWVGINFARALACAWNVPLVPCNHMEGHILTALIQKNKARAEATESSYKLLTKEVTYPALSLLISGGHTQIVLIKSLGSYNIIGDTRDDAIGECFDKVARTLGLAYPGGPKISKLAAEARATDITSPEPLPRPMIETDDLDFSFSGLKTAVLYLVKRLQKSQSNGLSEQEIKGISREVEDAVTEIITAKIRKAIEIYAIESIIVGGGVIANTNIRTHLEKLAEECSIKLLLPQFDHATDNGLMIALAGYVNRDKAVDFKTLQKAVGTLPLGPRI